MTNRSRLTSIIAAVLITTAAAATAAQTTPSGADASTLPGVGNQTVGCEIAKSKGPLGY